MFFTCLYSNMNNLINNLKCISIRRKFHSPSYGANTSSQPVMVALHNKRINGETYNDLKCVQLSLNCVNDKMSKRYGNNGIPPRKIPRLFGPFGYEFLPPLPNSLPPPPLVMNCGELREQHHGAIVELDGKVNKSRLGRFIELKDQHGATQLVAPPDNINMSKRFANMPLNSFITVVGQVKKRPANLKNFSMATGEVEVHVNNIIRVQKIFRHGVTVNELGKRSYSTMASKNEKCDENTATALTSIECKHVKNNENLVQWFMNRKYTCGSLRIKDAGKNVALVGWVDKRQAKFVHLMDGYGSMQILIEDETLKAKLDTVGDHDLVLINGRVLARPHTHITHNSPTGDIELYADNIVIIDANSVNDNTNKCSTKSASDERIRPDVNKFTYRTHNCSELRDTDIGKEVTICGWMEFSRMNRFFTLRDGYGHTQIIVPGQLTKTVNCDSISSESILKVKGRVIPRPPKMVNPKMETGAIEVELISLEVLNEASTDLPVQVREFNRSIETNRLKYRYIDLRFPDMQRNLRFRSNILMKMREYLINNAGFVEVETPTLFRRTPGGAQEFVVPSQKPGLFYSLVQSPQQFKQMLMAGAIDRYFQIARCYRDETTTPNRQPEFTQLDIELSFTQPNDIMNLIENVFLQSWPKEFSAITAPFRRMTFNEAMDRYGSDKPDTRYSNFLLQNVTTALSEMKPRECKNFSAYAISLQDNYASGFTQALELGYEASAQRKKINFATIRVDENGQCKDIKCMNDDQTKIIISELNLQPGDVAILTFGERLNVQNLMGKFRLDLISNYTENGIIPKVTDDIFEFLWVVDFPLFTLNTQTGQLETTHHPFTAPHPEDLHLLESPDTYDQCRSLAYDVVLNGQEIGGGSIRIHNAKFQKRILDDILQLETKHLSHLIAALESGCPPHGGIALGLDRLLSIICNTNSIRDVMAFPKSADGKDPLSKAPSEISKEELDLYHLQIKK